MNDAAKVGQADAGTGLLRLDTGLRRGNRYLYEIESLRGLAVLLVFLFHTRGIVFGNEAAPLSIPEAFLAVGNTGVTLFFVLSGFLLSGPWIDYLAGTTRQKPRLIAYAASRALRILPLYYGAIVVAAVDLKTTAVLLPAASFRMLGFDFFPHSVVWWTLITEMQFYLLLPLIGTLALAGRMGRWLLLLIALTWLGFYLQHIGLATEPLAGFTLTKSLFARLPAFLLGIGVCAVCRMPRPPRLGGAAAAALGALILVFLGLLLQQVAAIGENRAEKIWPGYHLWEATAWAALLLVLLSSTSSTWLKPLVNLPLAFFGKLSYSIYLNHVPLLFYLVYPVKQRGESEAILLLAAGGAALLSLLLAALTYRFVELPFLRLKALLPR